MLSHLIWTPHSAWISQRNDPSTFLHKQQKLSYQADTHFFWTVFRLPFLCLVLSLLSILFHPMFFSMKTISMRCILASIGFSQWFQQVIGGLEERSQATHFLGSCPKGHIGPVGSWLTSLLLSVEWGLVTLTLFFSSVQVITLPFVRAVHAFVVCSIDKPISGYPSWSLLPISYRCPDCHRRFFPTEGLPCQGREPTSILSLKVRKKRCHISFQIIALSDHRGDRNRILRMWALPLSRLKILWQRSWKAFYEKSNSKVECFP